jgi:hypothetical protein
MVSALSKKTLVKNVQRVNIAAAFATLILTIALMTPILDVHSIAVRSQLSALAEGRISTEKFDFRYLKFDSGRAGKNALEQLKTMEVADRAGLDVALKRVESLEQYDYSDASETSLLEEFNQWAQSGKIELYQPIQDPDFKQLVTSSGFVDSLRYTCIESGSRCVVMQTTQFNTPGIQYLVAKSTSEPTVNILLYYRDDQGAWTSAVEVDSFWYSGMLTLSAEELTQIMDKLATGTVTMKPITLQGFKIGDELYVPGIGAGLDVLSTQ